MSWMSLLRKGAQRLLLGRELPEESFRAMLPENQEETYRKSLDEGTQRIVRRRGIDAKGYDQSPYRRNVVPNGKSAKKVLGFSFSTLRALAQEHPAIRAAIDIRKREISQAEWQVRPALQQWEKDLERLQRMIRSVRKFEDRSSKLDELIQHLAYMDRRDAKELAEFTVDKAYTDSDVLYRFSLCRDDRRAKAERNCAKVRRLFDDPSRMAQNFSDILLQTVPDLYEINAMCIENRRALRPVVPGSEPPRSRWNNPIVELKPIDGATVQLILDKHGMPPGVDAPEKNLIAYEQFIDGRKQAEWRYWDLCYIQENLTTNIEYYGYAVSRVEHLVVNTLLKRYGDKGKLEEFKRQMYGGHLVFEKTGMDENDVEDFAERTEEVLQGTRRYSAITVNDGKVYWVATPMSSTNRDKYAREQEVGLLKEVATAFEMPMEKLSEQIGSAPRATSDNSKEMGDDGLRKDLKFLGRAFTQNIVHQFGYDDVELSADAEHERDDESRLANAEKRQELGIWDVNDTRIEFGMEPREGDDVSIHLYKEREKALGMAAGGQQEGGFDEGEEAYPEPDDENMDAGGAPVEGEFPQ